MPKQKTDVPKEDPKEAGRENFEDFLTVFSNLQESILVHTTEMQKVGELLAEDLIPAIDDLRQEVVMLRMVTADSAGKPKTILGQATQEIFGGGD